MTEGESSSDPISSELALLRARVAEQAATIEALVRGEVDTLQADTGRGVEPLLLVAAQRALREREQEARALFESNLDGILICDDAGLCLEANAAAVELLGGDRSWLLGQRFEALAAEGVALQATWATLIAFGQLRSETVLRASSGRQIDVELSATAHYVPGRHLVVIRDTTARRAAQRTLEEQERELRALFDGGLDGVMVFDAVTERLLEANPAASALLGFSREEIIGQHFTSFLPPGVELSSFREQLAREGHLRTDLALARKDRSLVEVEISMRGQYRPGRNVVFLRDLSERRAYEQQQAAGRAMREVLREPRSVEAAVEALIPMMRLMLSANVAELWRVEDDRLRLEKSWHDDDPRLHNFAAVNQSLVFSPGQGLAGSAWERAEPQFTDNLTLGRQWPGLEAEARQAGLSSAAAVPLVAGGRVGHVLVLFGSELRRWDSSIACFQELQGQYEQFVARATAELAARDATARLQAILDAVPVAITMMGMDGTNLVWNPAAERMFGFTKEEISPWKVVPEDRRGEIAWIIEETKSGRAVVSLETKRRRKSGAIFDASISTAPIVDHTGQTVAVVDAIIDLTERKNLEAQLLHAQKMEAIGRLAGGIAHDFNNLLAVILSSTEFARAKLQEGEMPELEDLAEIRRAASRAAGLTRQLLAFSRRQVMEPQLVDLNKLIGQIEKMLVRVIGEDVSLTTRLAKDIVQVRTDPGQIEQVLMNLALNARDAMPKGGRLNIESRTVIVDALLAEAYTIRPGRYAMLAVSDTGTGISPEVMERIFEPFFTTKEVGKGTGLGLATVYGIVEQSQGVIKVETCFGAGTTFRVYLPAEAQTVGVERSETIDLPSPRGVGRILLVEDEEPLRRVTRRILSSAGYEVIEACDGREALVLLRDPKTRVDLVISDVVMPQMNGPEVMQRIEAEGRSIPALFLSGYTEEAILSQSVHGRPIQILTKPFSASGLLNKAHEILERKRLEA